MSAESQALASMFYSGDLYSTKIHYSCQVPLSMGFSRQEYWSGFPFPFPGDLPKTGVKPGSPALQVNSLPSEPSGKPSEPSQFYRCAVCSRENLSSLSRSHREWKSMSSKQGLSGFITTTFLESSQATQSTVILITSSCHHNCPSRWLSPFLEIRKFGKEAQQG